MKYRANATTFFSGSSIESSFITNTKQDCVGVEFVKGLRNEDEIYVFPAGEEGKISRTKGMLNDAYQTAVMPGTSAVVAS